MSLQPGDTLLNGQYRIIRLLGRGGFGFVYLAEDTLLREEVALKELIPALVGDEAMLRRFLAEAKATMRLTHERIVRTFAVFAERGNYYIGMEYMAGGSLEARLAARAAAPRATSPGLPVEEAVRVAADVAEGLAYAHGRGVVHCDLKPANILFSADGRAKVADFGIAHVPREMFSRSWVTASGFVAGTLPYMSPEQADGVRDDPRADLYALGAVLYRMLAGRPYLEFEERDTPGAQARNVGRIQAEQPQPPSVHNRRVPAWLDAAVLRALAKDPAQRWPDPMALRAALLQEPAALGAPQAQPAPAAAAAPTMPAPAEASILTRTVPAAPPAAAAEPPATGVPPTRKPPPAGRRGGGRALWLAGCLALIGLGALIVAGVLLSLRPGGAGGSLPTVTAWPSATQPWPSSTLRPADTRPPATATSRPADTSSPASATPRSPTVTPRTPSATPRPTDPPPSPTATSRPTNTPRPPTDTPRPTDTPIPRPTATSTPSSGDTVTFVFVNEYRGTLDVFVDGQLVFRVQSGETKSVRVTRGVHRIGLCPLGYTNCPSSENDIDINSDPFVFTLR